MNPDTTSHILSFCGKAYIYLATVNKTWRRAYGTTTTTSICQAVTSAERIRIVLPTLRLRCSLNNAAFFHTSKNGNAPVLDLLLANKRPTALYACTSGAVAGGNLQTLSWAVSNGFPLDNFVCYGAASSGNLPMLKWASCSGCAWDPESCREVAAQNGHVEIAYFLDNYAAK